MDPSPLVLASASPRRRELLSLLGHPFEVVPSAVEETPEPGRPELVARRLAQAKAADVARRRPEAVVIGADTIVVLGPAVFGKPADEGDARRMLRALSGKTHRVITGVCVISPRATLRASEITRVTFRRLSERDICDYCAGGEPFDKAGAYGIQEGAAGFVARLEGCYNNVVGLPVGRLARMLAFVGVGSNDKNCPSPPAGDR